MASLSDSHVRKLVEAPNFAVVSTINEDGSVHSTVVWIDLEGDDAVAVNSAVGRTWPANLQRDPHITIVVYNQQNPYEFVEIRGVTEGTTEGADEHIDRLAKKYLGVDSYPARKPGEQRIRFVVAPLRVRYRKSA